MENESEYWKVENFIREAFEDIYMPGRDEHFIAYKLGNSKAFVKEFDLVV